MVERRSGFGSLVPICKRIRSRKVNLVLLASLAERRVEKKTEYVILKAEAIRALDHKVSDCHKQKESDIRIGIGMV